MADVETAEKPVLTFDGEDHVIENLSDTAKYFVTQLQDLASQEAQTKARLDQVTVAQKGFQDLLREELNKPEEEEDPDAPVTMEGLIACCKETSSKKTGCKKAGQTFTTSSGGTCRGGGRATNSCNG